METCRDLGFKHQKDSVSFNEDAGDTENKTDPKGGLAYTACPILWLANENERAGEATDEWEEEDVGQLSVCGLHYRGVAKSDKDSHHKGCQDDA